MAKTTEELQAELDKALKTIEDLTASNTAINSKNRELLSEKKDLEKKVRVHVDKLGIKSLDDEAVDDILANAEKGKGKPPSDVVDAKQVEKIRAQLQGEIDKANADAKTVRGQRDQFLIDSELSAAITAAKGSKDLLAPLIAKQVHIVEDGAKLRLEVLDTDGNAALVAGKPMTVAQLVENMKADPRFGRAFDGSGAAGSGSSSNPGPRPNTGEKTSLQKISAGLAELK